MNQVIFTFTEYAKVIYIKSKLSCVYINFIINCRYRYIENNSQYTRYYKLDVPLMFRNDFIDEIKNANIVLN